MSDLNSYGFGQTGSVSTVQVRNRVLRNTYALLALSMVPTVIGAWLGVAMGFSLFAGSPFIGFIVFMAGGDMDSGQRRSDATASEPDCGLLTGTQSASTMANPLRCRTGLVAPDAAAAWDCTVRLASQLVRSGRTWAGNAARFDTGGVFHDRSGGLGWSALTGAEPA